MMMGERYFDAHELSRFAVASVEARLFPKNA